MQPDILMKCLTAIAKYFKGQPFANVMSILQLASIAAIAYVGVNFVIPEERKAIFEATEAQRKDFLNSLDSIETTHDKQLDRMAGSFDRALDRFSNYRPAAGAQSEAQK